MKFKIKNQGFSLIEVMVALLVLALGILGIAKLQGTLIRNSSDANQRTVAASIAQQKIDDLKSFTKLSSGYTWTNALALAAPLPAREVAYAHIAGDNNLTTYTETGGVILPSASVTVGSTAYSLNWTVQDYWHTATLSAPTATQPVPAPARSDFKKVRVTVGWNDEMGAGQSISLDTVIDAYAPALTALADNSANGGLPPTVYHTPGVAPEVIPTCVSGTCDGTDPTALKKETDNPLPEVSQNDQFSTVKFSELTYFYNTNAIKKQEEFITVNCTCEQVAGSATVVAHEPAFLTLQEDNDGNPVIGNAAGATVSNSSRRIGQRIATGQLGQQSGYCNTCCRDHHDFTGAANKYDPFRANDVAHYPAGLNGDHSHFYPDNLGNLVAANAVGDTYLEACKLVLVDGIARVAQDWKQESIKVYPESTLLTSVTDYQAYIAQFVADYVTALDTSVYPLTTPVPATVLANEPDDYALTEAASEQMISRSIYIDYMPPALVTQLKTALDLELVPFHDINTTKLASWTSTASTQATVTNELLLNDNTHSRGLTTAIAAGTPNIVANMPNSNSGFANSTNTDAHDIAAMNDDITLAISGTPPSSSGVSLSGTISMSGASNLNFNQITVQGLSGIACTTYQTGNGNNKLWNYSCTLTSGSPGQIKFSAYNPTLCVGSGSNCVNTFYNNTVCPSANTVVTGDNSTGEYTLLAQTIAANTTLNLNIVNSSESCP